MSEIQVQMDITQQMEQYNIAYVRALAAQCGWRVVKEDDVDDDGIDISIKGIFSDEHNIVYRPRIEVQLKSTSTLDIKGNVIKYPLKARNYNLLCEQYSIPRYLFVLDLDSIVDNWVIEDPIGFILSRKCYWLSLENLGATTNTTSVTLDIPIHQVLNKESLNAIMKKAAVGGDL